MTKPVRGCGLALLAVVVVCATVAVYYHLGRSAPHEEPAAFSSPQPTVVTPLQIEAYCSKCHAYPPADSFPRLAWKEEVEKSYKLIAQSQLYLKQRAVPAPPPMEQVLRYYEERCAAGVAPRVD